ncbi:MAG: transporter [Endomicrobiales bacterium]|nr:transporter [Endomicrobiales bacterium]
MRKLSLFFCILLAFPAAALPEPLLLEQAQNLIGPDTLEAGVQSVEYSNDVTSLVDNSGNEVWKWTYTAMTIPVFARYAFNPLTEGFVSIPYQTLASKTEQSGGSSSSDSDSGLADPLFGVKYLVMDEEIKIAVGTGLTVPIGKTSDKFPVSFKKGVDLKPTFVLSRPVNNGMMHVNISYRMTGEFEDGTSQKTKHDPGDIVSIGAGYEYPYGALDLIGELYFKSFSESKIAGTAQSGSSGTQSEMAVGCNYYSGDIKMKFGLVLSLGEEKYRVFDYKILAGITYLVQI